VEEDVLTKAKAIEVIETAGELTREMADESPTAANQIAAGLVEAISRSFAAD
jgi:hypothetical protein